MFGFWHPRFRCAKCHPCRARRSWPPVTPGALTRSRLGRSGQRHRLPHSAIQYSRARPTDACVSLFYAALPGHQTLEITCSRTVKSATDDRRLSDQLLDRQKLLKHEVVAVSMWSRDATSLRCVAPLLHLRSKAGIPAGRDTRGIQRAGRSCRRSPSRRRQAGWCRR
jgi:hypothetical protein